MSHAAMKRQDFGPRCLSGGVFWACNYGTYFMGCCEKDPCTIMCPQGDLYPAAFDPAYYGKFPDATCGSGAKFYTCAAGTTFMGCCQENACANGGCPDSDLEPAILNRDDLRSAYHATGGSTMTSTTTLATATGTPLPLNTTKPGGKSNVAAIAGGAAGGAFVLAVVIGLLIYYICHAKKSRRGHADAIDRRLSQMPAAMTEKDKGFHSPDVASGWSSPNANLYPQDGHHYYSYEHQQPYQQYGLEPQEMPNEPFLPMSSTTGSVGHGHRRGFSELSGVTARSELGSPHEQVLSEQQNVSPMSPYGFQANEAVHDHGPHPSWAPTAAEDGYAHDMRAQHWTGDGNTQSNTTQRPAHADHIGA